MLARRPIEDGREMTRRSFFAVIGWGAFVVASGVALLQSLKFMFPNATHETPSVVKFGLPSDYAVGLMTVFVRERVVADGLYAFNAGRTDGRGRLVASGRGSAEHQRDCVVAAS